MKGLVPPERPRGQDFKPRLPRQSGERGELTPALEQLYAEVAGEDVSVLAEDGSEQTLSQKLSARAVRPSTVASLLSDVGLGLPLLGTLPAPTAEDLAATGPTAAVAALAQQLGNKPLALFNYVRTKVVAELYYGSKKGAEATLREQAGNDFDTASLLIALLRASSIPARYEYGTVRLSLEQAKALTGASTASDAAYLLAQSGIPVGVGADGQTVLMERAWVRAFVPYENYRGTGAGTGEGVWVRLDAGLKRTAWAQTVNLRGLANFDATAYLNTLNPKTPLEVYEGQLLAAAKAQNLCNNLAAAAYGPLLAEEPLRLLPAAHPAKVETSLLMFARPPTIFRWTVELSLDSATQSFELAELQYRKLAIRYPGATATDVATIAAAGDITNVVPFQVRVAPSLRLDGVEVQRMPSVLPGQAQALTVRVTVPGGSPVAVTHRLTAGSAYALSIAGGKGDAAYAATLKAAAAPLTGDDHLEATSHAVAALYAQHQQDAAARVTSLMRYVPVDERLKRVRNA